MLVRGAVPCPDDDYICAGLEEQMPDMVPDTAGYRVGIAGPGKTVYRVVIAEGLAQLGHLDKTLKSFGFHEAAGIGECAAVYRRSESRP